MGFHRPLRRAADAGTTGWLIGAIIFVFGRCRKLWYFLETLEVPAGLNRGPTGS